MSTNPTPPPLPPAFSMRTVPIAAAVVGALVTGVVAQTLDPKLLAAGALGLMAMIAIGTNPALSLGGMLLLRASIEKTQDRVLVHASGVGLSPTDVVSVAFLGGASLWLLYEVSSGNDFWRRPVIAPALLLLFVGFGSLLYSPALALGARDLVKWASGFCVYLVIIALRPDRKGLRRFCSLIVASAIFPIGFAWLQFVRGVGKKNILHGGLRIQSTFNHPTTFGFYLLCVLVTAWGLRGVVEGKTRRAVDVIAISAFLTTFLTLSRTTWAGLAVIVIVVGRRNRKLIGILLAGLVVTLLALPRVVARIKDSFQARSGSNTGNSILGRLEIWSGEIQAFRERPFLGHGFGYTLSSQEKASHNDFLRMMVETGVVGVVAFLTFLVSLLRDAWRLSRGRSGLPLAYLGLALGYAVQSVASNEFGKGVFQFYFWAVAGLTVVWADRYPPDTVSDETRELAPTAAGES